MNIMMFDSHEEYVEWREKNEDVVVVSIREKNGVYTVHYIYEGQNSD